MLEEDFYANHNELVLKALLDSKIAIAGAGGLGSNSAAALARSGIGTLIICDNDKIHPSNLNRQYYFRDQIGQYKVQALKHNLKMINPFNRYEIHILKLEPLSIRDIFEDVDLIIEAFDDAEEKQMLIETWSDYFRDIPLIIANGIGGFGKNNDIRQKNSGNLYIIGDGVSDVKHGFIPLAPRVSIVAAMQANLAVELIVKKYYNKG